MRYADVMVTYIAFMLFFVACFTFASFSFLCDIILKLLCDYYRYMFVAMIVYGSAIIPFVYVLSFMCKVASSAYVWITVYNIFSGT